MRDYGLPTAGPGIGPAPVSTVKLENGVVQTVGEAPPREEYPSMADGTQAERYLLDSGWEKAGTDEYGRTTWRDPLVPEGRKPTKTHKVVLPVQGGGTEVVYQWEGPPVPWDYDTTSALSIQNSRVRSGRSLEDRIRHHRDELVRLAAELEARAARRQQAEAQAPAA
jgi:uncharacterized small protein (DUF1192 family)